METLTQNQIELLSISARNLIRCFNDGSKPDFRSVENIVTVLKNAGVDVKELGA